MFLTFSVCGKEINALVPQSFFLSLLFFSYYSVFYLNLFSLFYDVFLYAILVAFVVDNFITMISPQWHYFSFSFLFVFS
ncbi:hypothetical protein BDF14DRAFT_1859117 [Spinellus fusiger]|nr:hypothetical protein BDF14DRAFT_1859116 [Spinellus fusiger]KAI7862191.1 hypothetical protein BDF14DRAFT_1859117 [Spinellus fusiger]